MLTHDIVPLTVRPTSWVRPLSIKIEVLADETLGPWATVRRDLYRTSGQGRSCSGSDLQPFPRPAGIYHSLCLNTRADKDAIFSTLEPKVEERI